MRNNRQESIFRKIADHWIMTTGLASGAFFLMADFVQQRYDDGYYEFWGIPTTYVSSHILQVSDAIQTLLIAVATLILCNIYAYFFCEFSNKKSTPMKWIIKVGLGLLLWIFGMLVLLVEICKDIGIKETFYGIIEEPFVIFWYTVPVSITFVGIVLICSFPWWNFSLEELKALIKNLRNCKGKILEISGLIGLACIIGGILWGSYSIYQSGQQAAEGTEYLDIVKINEKKYAAITPYKDSWILKEVLCSDNLQKNEIEKEFQLVKNHYMVYDIQGMDIMRLNVEGEDISAHFI